MRKFRIKVERKKSGNIYTPQIKYSFFTGWRSYTGNIYGQDKTFRRLKKAEEFIQEVQDEETTKTYYL